MRVTITVQDDAMHDLIWLTQAATKTAAVNEGLAKWARLQKRREIEALRGRLHIDGDLSALRAMALTEVGN